MAVAARPRQPAPTARLPLDEKRREAVVRALQSTLFELIDLGLQTKHAHWNVVGPLFHPIHELLDEFYEQHQEWSDQVAERMRALGAAVDGRTAAVGRESPLKELPVSAIRDADVVAAMLERVGTVATNTRQRMEGLGDADSVTENLLQEIVLGLEKQLWMLRVQTE